ncbi:malate dehydrogenase [Candidatus Deianiraea vastatrix]|uniref:Malate dehydrogenase n=1 Tax=Candidatus Deianiraea vastatrix TaxID=2163644 RepID=A0A5B8XFT0_9RICK|nr:malate dehydrogenase [Candidatus Deianiraea vastatrix]QED23214.1 Malate dehydrogenase [Candidatus Deianiraea vastatrix]
MTEKKKIALIGAGQIGGTMAHLLSLKGDADIVLFDIQADSAKGKALDISQTCYLHGSDAKIIGTGDYKDIEGSDAIVVTAGLPRKPGMSRDDLIETNYKIIKEVAENVKKYAPNAFVVIVTNPLDAMVYAFQKVSGLPANKVLGMAGILDTARFCTFLAEKFNLSRKLVRATVLGGHGDTMVPVTSGSTNCVVAGVPLHEYAKICDVTEEELEKIIQRTRDGGAEIVKLLGNGSAYYAPAASALQMVEAYLTDSKKTLPCCAKLNGEYGISGLYIGVQVVVGKNGCEKIVETSMTKDEKAMFDKSVKAVEELSKIIDKM